mgnify:CR=1 FL=1
MEKNAVMPFSFGDNLVRVIKDEENRGKGTGTEALKLLVSYCFNHLRLHQLYCNINEENINSVHLFKNHNQALRALWMIFT